MKNKLFWSISALTAVLIGSSAATFLVQNEIRRNVAEHGRMGQDNLQFAVFQLSSNLFELERTLQKYEDTKDPKVLDEAYIKFSVVYSSVHLMDVPAYDLIFKPEKFGGYVTQNLPKSDTTPAQKYEIIKKEVDYFSKEVDEDETLTPAQAERLEHIILPQLLKHARDLSMEASMIMNVYVSARAAELNDAGQKSVLLLVTQLLLVSILTVFLISRLKKSLKLSAFLKKTNEELVVIRDKLEASNRAKDVFLSSMTHELRTPLNSILGFTQILLSEKKSLNSEQLHFLTHIHDSGNHLTDLIDDILDFTKIEGDNLEFSFEYYSLHEQLHQVTTSLKPLADKAHVSIAIECDPCIYVLSDKKRLKQVLLNLMNNGIKYNKNNGKLYLRAQYTNNKVIIDIEDTGIGIPDKYKNDLFKPFNRLGHENGNIEGTGIGLTISKKMVEKMDGTLSVTSEEGIGSVFTIMLNGKISDSIVAHDEQIITEPLKEEQMLDYVIQHSQIIIVGNSDKQVHELLQQKGYITYNPENVHDFYSLLSHPIGFIIIDVDNTEIDGLSWLESAQQQNLVNDIPSLAVSDKLDENIMIKAIEMGVVEFMNKPLNSEYFFSVFNSHLKEYNT